MKTRKSIFTAIVMAMCIAFAFASAANATATFSAGLGTAINGDYLYWWAYDSYAAMNYGGWSDASQFVIDLGSEKLVTGLIFTNGTGGAVSPRYGYIQRCTNEADPYNNASYDYASHVFAGYFATSMTAYATTTITFSIPITARYLQVRITDNFYGPLNETDNYTVAIHDISLPGQVTLQNPIETIFTATGSDDTLTTQQLNGFNLITGHNGDGDNWIRFIGKLSGTQIIQNITMLNRGDTDDINTPKSIKIYVAQDESSISFDPCNISSYSRKIADSNFVPIDSNLAPYTYAANKISAVATDRVYRQYVLIEITSNAQGAINSTTNTLFNAQKFGVGPVLVPRVNYVTAGEVWALGADIANTAIVNGYPYISTQYSGNGDEFDGSIDFAVDQDYVKDIRSIEWINRMDATTNYNVNEVSIFVAPDEFALGFDPLLKDSYTQLIYDGMFLPATIEKAVVREADVTDVQRRWFRVALKSNFWGTLDLMDPYCYIVGSDMRVFGLDSVTDCNGVTRLGLNLEGDIDQDCKVDMHDVRLLAQQWLDCTNPNGVGCTAPNGVPNSLTIAKASPGSITIDSNLNDWTGTLEWIPLNQIYSGTPPFDINEAKFTARWDQSNNKVYLAVVVRDNNHLFQDVPSSYNSSDRIEIYSQGDAAGGTDWGAEGSGYFDVAQQYVVGPGSTTNSWASWATYPDGTRTIGGDAGFSYAVSVSGNQITYEIAVTQFDNYGGLSGGATAATSLAAGKIIGLDVLVGTRYNSGANYGMLSNNLLTGKSNNAGQFAQYELIDTLPQPVCGDWGYLSGDIDKDCKVNLTDFTQLAKQWLECDDPANSHCVKNW